MLDNTSLPAPSEGAAPEDVTNFFESGGTLKESVVHFNLSYRRMHRYHTLWVQQRGDVDKHHPIEKVVQARTVLEDIFPEKKPLRIYEAHGGHGYMSQFYTQWGEVTSCTYKDGNDLHRIHLELASGKQYNIVDLDPYGYPTRLLLAGVMGMLGEKSISVLFVTIPCGRHFPSPILRGINTLVYGSPTPSEDRVCDVVVRQGLLHHRLVKIRNVFRAGGIKRFAFSVERVPAQDIWTYKRHPDYLPGSGEGSQEIKASAYNPIRDLFGV